jgi:phosphoribosyl-ATP pyrophosphohydrolase
MGGDSPQGAAKMATNKLDATVLDRLYDVIESRRGADPKTSNTARMFARGTEKIAQKLGEEAIEAVIEGVRGKRKRLIAESADMLYFLLILWADRGIVPGDVWAELENRVGTSGIDEKKSRLPEDF